MRLTRINFNSRPQLHLATNHHNRNTYSSSPTENSCWGRRTAVIFVNTTQSRTTNEWEEQTQEVTCKNHIQPTISSLPAAVIDVSECLREGAGGWLDWTIPTDGGINRNSLLYGNFSKTWLLTTQRSFISTTCNHPLPPQRGRRGEQVKPWLNSCASNIRVQENRSQGH